MHETAWFDQQFYKIHNGGKLLMTSKTLNSIRFQTSIKLNKINNFKASQASKFLSIV